jgi:hypothetical protein
MGCFPFSFFSLYHALRLVKENKVCHFPLQSKQIGRSYESLARGAEFCQELKATLGPEATI